MINIETRSQQDTEFRLAVLGGGRLGDALARVWLARTGETPMVWSRSGPYSYGDAEKRIPYGIWLKDWTQALSARSVMMAIPGKAVLEMASNNEQAKTFLGNVFSAASSLSRESLQQVFPNARVICIAPFLINGAHSIPILALRHAELPNSEWEIAASELYNFGDLDVVRDDDLFSHLSLLGSAWPVVVLATIQAAANIAVQGLEDETAIGIGRRLFFRAMQSLLSTQTIEKPGEESSGESVATPGGITEQGLKNIGGLTILLESAFEKMRARANELRA